MSKTVVITGGSRGIGKAVALAFCKQKANIVLNYLTTEPTSLIAEIEAAGANCLAVQADVSFFLEAERLIKTAFNHFGSVDVLVNNAGITKDSLLLRMDENDFDSVINTNLKGTFNTIRHVSGIMLKQRRGSIINMASVIGICGNAGQANYAASKAGIIGLTKSTAKELAGRGITCNAIAPGFIETDMTNILTDQVKSDILRTIPVKRFGQPEDVANLAVFLAENTYITGQVIQVDGGMVM